MKEVRDDDIAAYSATDLLSSPIVQAMQMVLKCENEEQAAISQNLQRELEQYVTQLQELSISNEDNRSC